MSSVFSVLKRNKPALDFHRLCFLFFCFFIFSFSPAVAQVGEHRNDLSVGFNGGVALSNVSFLPKVPQDMHTGLTGGLSFRYVSEKYFSSICAVTAEVNYAQIGWKESILSITGLTPMFRNWTLPTNSQSISLLRNIRLMVL